MTPTPPPRQRRRPQGAPGLGVVALGMLPDAHAVQGTPTTPDVMGSQSPPGSTGRPRLWRGRGEHCRAAEPAAVVEAGNGGMEVF